ncbi:MAG: DUF4179 domain-containing protein [Coriobacteriales bacterium]
MRERYREELNAIEMGEPRRAELVELVAAELEGAEAGCGERAEAPLPRRCKGAPVKTALVLAACLALGLGTALAAGPYLTTGDALDALFNGVPARTLVMDSIGQPVNAAATSNGVTVKAEAIAGDEQSYSIVYSISFEGGLPQEMNSPEYSIVLEGGSHVQGAEESGGRMYTYDSDPDDSAVCYVEQNKLRSASELKGRTCHVRFNRIVASYHGEDALPGGDNRATIAEGPWEFRFTVDYEDLGAELCGDGPVEDPNWEGMRLASANLTPLALQLEFDVERDGSQFIEVSSRVKETVGSCELKLDDGSTLSFDLSACPSNTSGNGGLLRCEVYIPFEGVVDVEAVRSVKLGGVLLEL